MKRATLEGLAQRGRNLAARHPATLRWAARGILLLSLIFLGRSVQEASLANAAPLPGRGALFALLLSAPAYAGLLVVLALAWSQVLAHANGTAKRIRLRETVAVYGISILPKYIPGSVFQYGSRQLLGRERGWSTRALTLASGLEVLLHVLCASVIAALLLALATLGQAHERAAWLAFLAGLPTLCTLAGLALLGRRLPPALTDLAAPAIRSALLQALFFAGMAALAMVCAWAYGVGTARLASVGGLFLLSWLAGFAVPVMPGGLGVREAAGISLLSGVVGLETALMIQFSMRLVMLAGDALLFLIALACRRALRPPE
ncbi:hypothetical protein [Novosphingobium mangrovi (ex Hu et al. 2023)]|uniref:Lysylphosphatidylglycerol synthetase family protein n=1 Tax=Novosphingobium mangrovi (ex Hu et al. 2023) TaxID=2930094 RepID=A0ABT0AG19_9SPHN|nr:hypothetical protein [Novosphingobium mangrovi (ex Hu et al. 2023)]MCJ1962152.1 hypothetical protein [Novosphingobium mangrovi (ex Hu et al. 2023)]